LVATNVEPNIDILGVARGRLFQSNLTKTFWCLAITHGVYLINRIPTLLFNKGFY